VEQPVDEVDILGIDLGTTNSAIAIWDAEAEQVRLLPNEEGDRVIPSAVLFDPEAQEPTVGKAALKQLLIHPERVVYSVKRFIGRTFSDELVSQDQRLMTYSIQEAQQRKVAVNVGKLLLTPSQISAYVLKHLKANAEATLGRPITKAVITVPAYFNESQRQATKEAAELAGLHVPRIINEPTAAALAFGLKKDPQIIAVYDLGGGTFDISILEIKPGGLFRVKATDGDTHLGGDDFDGAVTHWLKQAFEAQHGVPLQIDQDRSLRARLQDAARSLKIALTKAEQHTVELPNLCTVSGQVLGLETTITRTQFEQLLLPLIERSLAICDSVLAKARLKPEDIHQVLMIGGQTRTPAVKAALQSRFSWTINDSVNPDEAVARGAAVLAARLQGHLRDDVTLWDVTPLSLGIELANGKMDVIIQGNQQIPITKWRKGPQAFTTQRDGQERIRFRVYQGERPVAIDNTHIGDVVLNLATSRPAGEPRIHCMFKVDHDGILHVRAEDASTDGEPVEATFDHVYRLTQEEVEEKLREAEIHQEADQATARLFLLEEELQRLRQAADDEGRMQEALSTFETAINEQNLDQAEALLSEIKTNFLKVASSISQ
jgi:molecular chaperone DnaK